MAIKEGLKDAVNPRSILASPVLNENEIEATTTKITKTFKENWILIGWSDWKL